MTTNGTGAIYKPAGGALDQPASLKKIVIFRALNLGDLLLAVPAFRALRAGFPQAEISLIGLPWAAAFARRYQQYIDRFVEFSGYPGINEVPVDPERTRAFLAEQRAYGYDIALQMHGNGQTSNALVLDLKARMTIGYYKDTPPDGLTRGLLYPEDQPEIYRHLDLIRLLGCERLDPRLEFPLFDEDHTEAVALLQHLARADRPWIGLHAGARPPVRRWPAEYFATVADTLACRFGAQIILTGGPGEEETAQQVETHMHMPALNIAGQTSLGGLAALISKLDLFISNDTGPAHVADAVDCPSITVFGPAEFQRWRPLDGIRHPSLRRPVACSPCNYWACPIDHRCLRWLGPQQVINAAQPFLYTMEKEKYHETLKNTHMAYSRKLSQ